mgnify:CR=1 FL=1
MKLVRLNSHKIAYDDAGSGQVILFIHGFPLHRKLWQPQIDSLTQAARVIAVDLRGHGESDSAPGSNTMQAMAEDCFDLLTKIGVSQPVILCGLSMGGYVAFSAYRQYPHRIAGLILAATRAAADSDLAKQNRNEAIATIQKEGAAKIIESMSARLLSPTSLEKKPDLLARLREMMQSIPTQTYLSDLSGLRDRPDATGLLPTITKPVMIIHGADDQIVPLEEARAMHAQIPASELRIIPQAGHLPNLEQPDLFNRAILDFLSKFPEAHSQ